MTRQAWSTCFRFCAISYPGVPLILTISMRFWSATRNWTRATRLLCRCGLQRELIRRNQSKSEHALSVNSPAFYYSRLTIYYLPKRAPVAQLDRVPDYESGGRMFESCRVHHSHLTICGRL